MNVSRGSTFPLKVACSRFLGLNLEMELVHVVRSASYYYTDLACLLLIVLIRLGNYSTKAGSISLPLTTTLIVVH